MRKGTALKILTNAQELFKGVSPSKWISSKFTDGKNKCCALGHYARLISKDPSDYSDGNCSFQATGEKLRTASEIGLEVSGKKSCTDIAYINNNMRVGCYTQKTIKGRVMASLRDSIKALSA